MTPVTGILLKLGSLFVFMMMAALIKWTDGTVPTGQVVFFRSFFAMPVILIWLALRGDLSTGLRTDNPMGHFWRGIIGTCGMAFGFASLTYLPLPDVTAIGFVAPLLTVVLAAILLGERLRAFRMAAVVLGLIGVAIVMSPRLTIFSGSAVKDAAMIGVILVLISAGFRALAQIHIRRLAGREQTAAIVFYFSLTASILALTTAPFGWIVPDGESLAILIGAGLAGGVGQILLTSAYRFAGASVIAPFDYASILFAVAIGHLWFDEVPSLQVLVGSAVVIAAGVLIIWREHQLGLERGKARPGLTPQG